MVQPPVARIAAPMSAGSPTRWSGSDAAVLASIAAFLSAGMWSKRSVSQKPVAHAFTRAIEAEVQGQGTSQAPRGRRSSGGQRRAVLPGRRFNTPATNVTEPPSARRGATYLAQCHAVQNFESIVRASATSSSATGPCGARPAAETTKASYVPDASPAANAATDASSAASTAAVSTAARIGASCAQDLLARALELVSIA